MQTIFITGASSGIGKATAALFATKGWHVVATMRDPRKGKELESLGSVECLPLDVTNTEQIRDTCQKALRAHDVDVLLNNAGYGIMAPLEVPTEQEIRRLFEASASLHADEQPTKADFGQLDLLRFRPFFEKSYGLPMPEENRELVRTVKNMNLATDDDRLNLAGLLMFGRHPEHFVPQFCIKAARVNGTDFSFMSYADREDYAGTLPDLYAGAMAFVLRNMHKRQRAESVNMPGESEIPRVVFEEIIVNADTTQHKVLM